MKRWPVKLRYILISVAMIVLVVLVMQFNQRISEMNRLVAQLREVRIEGTAVMQTQVALQTQIEYAGSDAAVEDWAMEADMGLPGNKPVVLIPAEGEQAPATQQGLKFVPAENWEVWWALFFDE